MFRDRRRCRGVIGPRLSVVCEYTLMARKNGNRVLTQAKIQYIHRYPTLSATNPKINGAAGTPKVIINAQTPIHLARSFLKNVSATTALPIAPAGLIKNAVIARQSPIVPYDGLFAHPTFPIKLQTNERRKIGRRP